MRSTVIIIAFAFSINYAFAQSHTYKQCKYSKTYSSSSSLTCPACTKNENLEKQAIAAEAREKADNKVLFGALAVDRSNGFYYGWAYDHVTLQEAEKRAQNECNKKGGNCSIVLSFSGSGCAVYRTIDGNVGTAYGWGVAGTREEADQIAKAECLKRSNGALPSNYVWTCNSTNKVPLRELYNAKDEFTDVVNTHKITSASAVAFSSDGRRLAVGDDNGIIKIWAVPSFTLMKVINIDQARENSWREVLAVAFSPDGKTLAASCFRNQIKTFDVATGREIKMFGKHMYEVPGINYSYDGRYLVSAGEYRKDHVAVWNSATGEKVLMLDGHDLGVRTAVFSPDNSLIGTVSIDGKIGFWSMPSGNIIRTIAANHEQLYDGAFSPDGKLFATIAFDGDEKVKVWDVQTGSLVKTFAGHGTYGYSIAFYGNNKIISTGMNDTIKLWDVPSGSQATYTLNAYYNSAVSPDGYIACVGSGNVEIWKIDDNHKLTPIKELN